MEYLRWRRLRFLDLRNPEIAACVANDILAERLIARLCPGNGTFVDIGAHIGSVFSEVHRRDSSISIHAFEAEGQKARALRERFPYCTVHDFALGETEGVAQFQINEAASGYNTLAVDSGSGLKTVSVQVRTLDSVVIEGRVDVMKIDVEGAELGVLKGGAKLLERDRPAMMFESVGLGVNALGYSPALLWGFLDGVGYQVFAPNRLAHDCTPLSRDAFLDAHHYPFHTHNYFAVCHSRRTQLRDRAREILGIRAGEY